MMNDTANIPSGKITAHTVADSIQLPRQETPYCGFHNAASIAFPGLRHMLVVDGAQQVNADLLDFLESKGCH